MKNYRPVNPEEEFSKGWQRFYLWMGYFCVVFAPLVLGYFIWFVVGWGASPTFEQWSTMVVLSIALFIFGIRAIRRFRKKW